jgi:hypothetical protein
MDLLLQHRKLQLWDQVCKQYSINTTIARNVSTHIKEGTLQEYLDKTQKRKHTK